MRSSLRVLYLSKSERQARQLGTMMVETGIVRAGQSLGPFTRLPRVELDWYAYWERFKELHGEPVQVDNRVLFPDGWQYSATNFAGPEYPPPENKVYLWQLQRAYWRRRLALVQAEYKRLDRDLRDLRDLRDAKDAPLQRRMFDRDVGRTEVADLDLEPMEARLKELALDVNQCKGQLAKLGAEHASDPER